MILKPTRIKFLVTSTVVDGQTIEQGFTGNAEVALELCAKMQEILEQDAFFGFDEGALAQYARDLFKHGWHIGDREANTPLRDIKGELDLTHYTKRV